MFGFGGLTKLAIVSFRWMRYGRQDAIATSSSFTCISNGLALLDSTGLLNSELKQLSDLLEEPNNIHVELGGSEEFVQNLL